MIYRLATIHPWPVDDIPPFRETKSPTFARIADRAGCQWFWPFLRYGRLELETFRWKLWPNRCRWRLLTACRKLPALYPMAPSLTCCDLPFGHNTSVTDGWLTKTMPIARPLLKYDRLKSCITTLSLSATHITGWHWLGVSLDHGRLPGFV